MTDTHEDDIERVKAAARREFEIHRTGNMDNLWLRVARAAIEAMQQTIEGLPSLAGVSRGTRPNEKNAVIRLIFKGPVSDEQKTAIMLAVSKLRPTKP